MNDGTTVRERPRMSMTKKQLSFFLRQSVGLLEIAVDETDVQKKNELLRHVIDSLRTILEVDNK